MSRRTIGLIAVALASVLLAVPCQALAEDGGSHALAVSPTTSSFNQVSEYDQGSGLFASSYRYDNRFDSENAEITLFSDGLVSWWQSGSTWYGSNGTVVNGAVGFGIDVSEHQGVIDWSRVKSSGVTYAILRCGYGSDYANQDDKQFFRNVQGCRDNGIPFGVYLYSYATNDSMAKSEADHTIRLLNEAGISRLDLSYPIYYDMEDEGGQGRLSRGELAGIATTYCNALANAGYVAGVYANTNWWTYHLTDSVFGSWPKWVAQYNTRCTYSGTYGMWQASSRGSINGIAGGVDVNFDFNGPIVHDDQWVYAGGSWWYRYRNGSYPADSWAFIKGSWYHFDSAGWMQTGWVNVDGSWYYLSSSGAMLSGWQFINGAWYYLSPENGAMRTGWLEDNGHWYWLGDSGAMQTGWMRAYGKWYYASSSGAMLDGWQYIDSAWYYLEPGNGSMRVNWLKLDDAWYWLGASGNMASNAWISVSGKWYRASSSGPLLAGWQRIDGFRYWFDLDSCAMATGWLKQDGEWFYLSSSGAMDIGWVNVSGVWYYCLDSGAIAVGFQRIGSMDYLFADSGAMQTGWAHDDEGWRYFADSGAMVRSSWIGDYYLREDGLMATDSWIGQYYVGDDGKWIPNYTED